METTMKFQPSTTTDDHVHEARPSLCNVVIGDRSKTLVEVLFLSLYNWLIKPFNSLAHVLQKFCEKIHL